MTPEQAKAVDQTREFLMDLAMNTKTIPKWVRLKAKVLIRNFPYPDTMSENEPTPRPGN
jgi:hypothetical protein